MPRPTVGNLLWFLLAGVWIAIAHVVLGLVLCLTIVGIPLGLGNFKLAAVAIAPLGKEIVSTSELAPLLGLSFFERPAGLRPTYQATGHTMPRRLALLCELAVEANDFVFSRIR